LRRPDTVRVFAGRDNLREETKEKAGPQAGFFISG